MLHRNFVNNEVKFSKLMDPAVLTADADGGELDCRGFESNVIAVLVGESGDTLSGSVFIELELEESDTSGSGFTDVVDADIVNPDSGAAAAVSGTNTGTFALIDAAAEDDVLVFVRYTGTKRYIRAVVNVTGTHTNGTPVAMFGAQARGGNYPLA